MPFFSIIIPAKGRPEYTRDTILSILLQDYGDFEILLSNNGADPSVRAAVEEFKTDPRFRYVEQPETLNMPAHWNLLVASAIGEYLLIRPNRRVLKQGTLKMLAEIICKSDSDVSLISWRVDSYDNFNKKWLRTPNRDSAVLRLPTTEVLCRFAQGEISLMNDAEILPLALNSCVSMQLIKKIRRRENCVFQSITPDYRFAFSSLLSTDELFHCTNVLDIAQGFEVSNGLDAYTSDAAKYFSSLGTADLWRDVPIKSELVFNGIWQDFFNALRVYERPEILQCWSRQSYYRQCLAEIGYKKSAGRMKDEEIRRLHELTRDALQKESHELQSVIAPSLPRLIARKMMTLLRLIRVRLLNREPAASFPSSVAVNCSSVLVAAGFDVPTHAYINVNKGMSPNALSSDC